MATLLSSDVGGFENTTIDTSDTFYWKTLNNFWSITDSTTGGNGPRSGTWYLGQASDAVARIALIGEAAETAAGFNVTAAVGAGGAVEGVVWIRSEDIFDGEIEIEAFNAAGTLLDTATTEYDNTTHSAGVYTETTVSMTTPANTAYVLFTIVNRSGGEFVNYDDAQFTVPDEPTFTLYWTNTGFRFPYPRWT